MIGSVFHKNIEEEQFFKISRDDLGPLLIDRMGLAPNLLSPFTEALDKYTAGSGHLSAEGEKLSEDELFKKLAPVLAAPDLLIRNRLGGSMIPFDEIRACAGKSLGQAIAVVAVGDEGLYVLRVFNDFKKYVSWWVKNFAGKNEEVVANYIPPKISLGSFLLLLHAVDWFKRESYQNTLDYAAGEEIYVNPVQFSQSLGVSVKSKDLRWLLPSFIMLVPNIDRYNFGINPEEISVLISMHFFNQVKKPGTNENAFLFGEAGHAMGVEFMRTWLMSAGFELSYSSPTGVAFLDHFFVAPTALANHFVSFEMTDNSHCLVNHQAYTLQYLAHRLETIISKAMADHVGQEPEQIDISVSPPVEPTVVQPGPADQAPSGQWYLTRGGNQYGPYNLEQLWQFAQEGRVQPDDLVWHEGLHQWVEAGTLEEFNFG